MSMLESLLRAVVAKPEDDAPRLILADWLQENGEPFIPRRLREPGRLWAIAGNEPTLTVLYWRTLRRSHLYRLGIIDNWQPPCMMPAMFQMHGLHTWRTFDSWEPIARQIGRHEESVRKRVDKALKALRTGRRRVKH